MGLATVVKNRLNYTPVDLRLEPRLMICPAPWAVSTAMTQISGQNKVMIKIVFDYIYVGKGQNVAVYSGP